MHKGWENFKKKPTVLQKNQLVNIVQCFFKKLLFIIIIIIIKKHVIISSSGRSTGQRKSFCWYDSTQFYYLAPKESELLSQIGHLSHCKELKKKKTTWPSQDWQGQRKKKMEKNV